jgi:hypothetical protein
MKLLVFIFCLFQFNIYAQEKKLNRHERKKIEKENFDNYYRDLKISNSEKINELHSKIDNGEIAGIELIIAGPTSIRFESRFGHALLRFVDFDQDWTNDLVVSFVADVNEVKLNAMKGLFGGYEILSETNYLYEFWWNYVLKEARPLNRYVIPLTKTELANFLNNFKKYNFKDLEKRKNYYFFGNNCAQAISDLLIETGLIKKKSKALIPTRMPKKLKKAGKIIHPVSVIESIHPTLIKLQNTLNLKRLEDILEEKKYPPNSETLIRQNFSDKEIKILLLYLSTIPYEIRESLKKDHHFQQGVSFDEIMSVENLDLSLYLLD